MENSIRQKATCEQELAAIRDSLEILGGKWKLRIMRHLNNHIAETNTFKKIQREVEGISAKMLSKELQELEINELVKRTVCHTKPITVEYEITMYGKTLEKIIGEIAHWGDQHRKRLFRKSA